MRALTPAQALLHTLSSQLLAETDDFLAAYHTCAALHALLLECTGLSAQDSIQLTELRLPSGKALAPFYAAACIQDPLRTKKFARGVFEAISAARKRFPGERLHLLYAGTGPFATLILPLCTVFSPAEIGFTLLEAHPESASHLHKVIDIFGLQDFVQSIEETDATTYQASQPFHILLIETMQAATATEPQLAITQHLVPQLAPGGILIPQAITIQSGLLNPGKEDAYLLGLTMERDSYVGLSPVFQLDTNTALQKTAITAIVHVPWSLRKDYQQLMLFTTVQITDTILLDFWESGLTIPQRLSDITFEKDQDCDVLLQYQQGENPKFYTEKPLF
jgi:hypothetical protein